MLEGLPIPCRGKTPQGEVRQVISDEAVEAAASIIAQEALVNAAMDGYGWDAETDSPEPFMPLAREQARRYLEAAAPHMLAEAWDQGTKARRDYRGDIVADNPYKWTRRTTQPALTHQGCATPNPYRRQA